MRGTDEFNSLTFPGTPIGAMNTEPHPAAADVHMKLLWWWGELGGRAHPYSPLFYDLRDQNIVGGTK